MLWLNLLLALEMVHYVEKRRGNSAIPWMQNLRGELGSNAQIFLVLCIFILDSVQQTPRSLSSSKLYLIVNNIADERMEKQFFLMYQYVPNIFH